MDDLITWLLAQIEQDERALGERWMPSQVRDRRALELEAKRRLIELHGHEPRSGWYPDEDDTPGAYGSIERACMTCGSQDLAQRWPCPTIRLLALPFSDRPGHQESWKP